MADFTPLPIQLDFNVDFSYDEMKGSSAIHTKWSVKQICQRWKFKPTSNTYFVTSSRDHTQYVDQKEEKLVIYKKPGTTLQKEPPYCLHLHIMAREIFRDGIYFTHEHETSDFYKFCAWKSLPQSPLASTPSSASGLPKPVPLRRRRRNKSPPPPSQPTEETLACRDLIKKRRTTTTKT